MGSKAIKSRIDTFDLDGQAAYRQIEAIRYDTTLSIESAIGRLRGHTDFGFKDGAAPTIIHMTIKPQEIVDEEEANKNPRDRDGNERSPGCRCMIM